MVLKRHAEWEGPRFLLCLWRSAVGLRIHHCIDQRDAWRSRVQGIAAREGPDHQAVVHCVGEIEGANKILRIAGESTTWRDGGRLNGEGERHAGFGQITEMDCGNRARSS